MENSLIRPDPGELTSDRNMDRILHFYGVVKDNDSIAVKGAVVIVFACFAGGVEKALAATFTDREGAYYFGLPKPPDYNQLLGFKVRAGKAYTLPEGVDSPGDLLEHPVQEDVLNFEHRSKQEEVFTGETPGAQAGERGDGPGHDRETDEYESAEADTDSTFIDESTTGQEINLTVTLSQVNSNLIPVVVTPSVRTNGATDVSTNSVTINGSINNTGGENCDQRKFRVRQQGSESWADVGLEKGSFGPEPFSFKITGLDPGAVYEFKAMAHNSAGWGEGEVSTFSVETFTATPGESTGTGKSRITPKRDASPKGSKYDSYRSVYWRWLGTKK